ncbi:hypothetical protein [Burkholderia gladioli]|uniref:Uncharacterized protein n=2 Tax=Burkholderia gladioli TaxID=28095 RepID=A0AAW3F469_BURGA|nr:hypothetical protein [Burkholderia gladioli]AJW95098.1 hypothetical protein BM43_4794 [Burkholderia gladioli]ASD82411.1 hypothetical protein CEJ98_26030 [Burkholderia gladioli pv. gladioli]AWY52659.1 hypothetical protein A8H28_16565 [Burkholderia gladioli pv. gladioli]KGC14655.1 hypothetical protein DM48_2972 [Burkholderia gladioli]KKJ08044.1 hypothetical protein XF14_00385 [Burkholderia gladioli]
MKALTTSHKVRAIAKRHARAAFMAAAGFVASAGAHAQQGHAHAAARPAAAQYVAQYAAIDGRGNDSASPDGATRRASASPVSPSSAASASPDWTAYVDANRRVLAGQADLAVAMGLSGAAGQAASAAGTLGDDSDASRVSSSTLAEIGGAQQSIALALSQAFASASSASALPVDRDSFSSGLASLGEGLQRFEGLPSGAQAAAPDAASSRFAEHAPDQIDAAAATLNDAVRYASVHGIEVPPVATLALRRIAH